MIGSDGYFDFATREPAPHARIAFYNTRSRGDMFCLHSYEGWYRTYKVQLVPERHPTAPQGVVLEDGDPIQFAPQFAATVHGHMANLRGPGWEADGTNAKPITAAQAATFLRLIRETAAHEGRTPKRWTGTYPAPPPDESGTLWIVEHRQMGPTACPSSRYAPLYALLEQEGDMPDPRVDEVIAALGGLEEIRKWNQNGNSLLLGYALEQQKLATHGHSVLGTGNSAKPVFPKIRRDG